MNKNQSLLFVF